MGEEINEKISVIASFGPKGIAVPRKIRWQGREYLIEAVSYHHRVRQGRVLLHMFHVTDGRIDFHLKFDTESLTWTLIELYDAACA